MLFVPSVRTVPGQNYYISCVQTACKFPHMTCAADIKTEKLRNIATVQQNELAV